MHEYFEVLLCSPYADRRQKVHEKLIFCPLPWHDLLLVSSKTFIISFFQTHIIPEPLESSIDQEPFVVDAEEDGMIAAVASEMETRRADAEQENSARIEKASYHPHKDNTP